VEIDRAALVGTGRSSSDLCFYAIKDGEVVGDATKDELFGAVNTSQCAAPEASCPTGPVSVSSRYSEREAQLSPRDRAMRRVG